jgi:hypothetical protein
MRLHRYCRIRVILCCDDNYFEDVEYNWRTAYERVTVLREQHCTSIERAAHWEIYFLIQSKINSDGHTADDTGASDQQHGE